jgi:hypothetical protein
MDTYQEFWRFSAMTGVSLVHAERIVASPSRTESILYDGVTIGLHTTPIANAEPAATALIIVVALPGRPGRLSHVLKMYDSFAENIAALSPTELLTRFADRFGLPMRFGATQETLFLGRTVDTMAPYPGIDECEDIATTLIVRYDEVGGRRRANCALCFAIDTARYHDYLIETRTK